jgi:hypothetical protein
MASQRRCDIRRSSPRALTGREVFALQLIVRVVSEEQYSEGLRRIKTESHTATQTRQAHRHIHNGEFALEVEAVGARLFLR